MRDVQRVHGSPGTGGEIARNRRAIARSPSMHPAGRHPNPRSSDASRFAGRSCINRHSGPSKEVGNFEFEIRRKASSGRDEHVKRARLDLEPKRIHQTIGRIARQRHVRSSAPARSCAASAPGSPRARACSIATLIKARQRSRNTARSSNWIDRLESGVNGAAGIVKISLDLRGARAPVHAVIADQRAVVAADDPRVGGPEQAVRRIEHMRLIRRVDPPVESDGGIGREPTADLSRAPRAAAGGRRSSSRCGPRCRRP